MDYGKMHYPVGILSLWRSTFLLYHMCDVSMSEAAICKLLILEES